MSRKSPNQPVLDMIARFLPVTDRISITIGGTTVDLDLSLLDNPEAMAAAFEAEAGKAWPDVDFGN